MHEINKRGIMMGDCAPRNVIVDEDSKVPSVIDLAQCKFKDRVVAALERYYTSDGDIQNQGGSNRDEYRFAKDEDEFDTDKDDAAWSPDVEYWEQAIRRDNPGAIGVAMTNILHRTKGWKLDIKYSGCGKIIADIRSQEQRFTSSEYLYRKDIWSSSQALVVTRLFRSWATQVRARQDTWRDRRQCSQKSMQE